MGRKKKDDSNDDLRDMIKKIENDEISKGDALSELLKVLKKASECGGVFEVKEVSKAEMLMKLLASMAKETIDSVEMKTAETINDAFNEAAKAFATQQTVELTTAIRQRIYESIMSFMHKQLLAGKIIIKTDSKEDKE